MPRKLSKRFIDGLTTTKKGGEATYDSEVTGLANRYWPNRPRT